jgi:hypothetical protein
MYYFVTMNICGIACKKKTKPDPFSTEMFFSNSNKEVNL